jgi:hypothetical protein
MTSTSLIDMMYSGVYQADKQSEQTWLLLWLSIPGCCFLMSPRQGLIHTQRMKQ